MTNFVEGLQNPVFNGKILQKAGLPGHLCQHSFLQRYRNPGPIPQCPRLAAYLLMVCKSSTKKHQPIPADDLRNEWSLYLTIC